MNALVKMHEGQPMADSREVAAAFGKQHQHVLRAANELLKKRRDLASNFGRKVSEVNIGSGAKRKTPYLLMTRDGFTLLAMGFTGEKALDWKVRYMEAFNAMEVRLQSEPDNLPRGDDLSERHVLMSECRTVNRLYGKLAARRHLMASGRFEHIRDIADRIEQAEYRQIEKVLPNAEPGLLWAWAEACGVRPNPACATPFVDLLTSYLNWCSRMGRTPLSDRLFALGLTNAYGREQYRRTYALELNEA